MSNIPHAIPSRMTHNVAALYGHADDTLIAWQQACVHAADALQPPPDPERLAKALALAQDGAVRIEDDGDALVTSGDARYLVRAGGTYLCPDAQYRGASCKHRLAMQIHQQATAQLAPNASAVLPRAATPPPVPAQEPRQGRSPSADRWDVTEAPASCCLRLRIGELELMYTMRDVSDAELTSRVQHLVPWVQDVLDQARERQAHLEALRQQREAAQAAPTAPAPSAPPQAPPPADLQVLLQQAVQQVLATAANGQASGTPPPAPSSHGTAPSAPAPDDQQTGFCSLHQVPMAQKQNARGSFYGHWLAAEQRHCNGRRNGRR
jgi:hypothetical protein